DSLILEQQRLHTYQALSSSAYLALTTSDPVATAFILRNELYQLASQEKQFKEEYTELAVKCMDFAISCVDLCRTSDELHCLLGGTISLKPYERGNPLNTIKNAIQSHEKKFVAHPNCQHQMENLFYSLMFCIRDFEGLQRLQFVFVFLSLLPFLYAIYLFFPHFKMPLPQSLIYRDRSVTKYEVTEILRCPVTKFLGHMVSYLTFLMLITVATFRLDRTTISDDEDNWEVRYTEILSYDFRTSNVVMTKIQIILLFWILGQLCMECKQVYHYGLRYFFRSYYNFMDWVSIALYLASYSLRIIVDFKVQASMGQYEDALKVAQSILLNATCSASKFCSATETTTHEDYVNYRNKILIPETAYWLRGCRLWWAPDDPEYISDCLFALGNVLSFSRISYLMPAWELLGPLQISLARMVSDIIRFMALFTVMVIAFVVGLTNLYWYFANIIVSVDAHGQLIRYASGIPSFKSTGATFHTLYWALFGQSSTNVTTIDENLATMYPGHEYLAVHSSPYIVNSLGSVLYAIYNACMIIILLNMLIAMMSKSFDEIQGDRLEEWKFARASLWLVYIDQEGVLPVPLNLLPSREVLSSLLSRFYRIIQWRKLSICTKHHCELQKNQNVILFNQNTPTKLHSINSHLNQNIRKTHTTTTVSTLLDTNSIHSNEWTSDVSESENETEKTLSDYKLYTDTIRADVMRRYLFKLQKQKEEELKSTEFSVMSIQRQQLQKLMDNEVKRKQDIIHDKLTRKESKTQGDEENDEVSPKSAAEIGDENRLRGLRSLLMPPSVRKKLEAVASVNHSGNELEKREAAEAAARFYLLQTTKKEHETSGVKLSSESFKSRHSYSNQPKNETFTARTERPIKGVHLRELYGVEQEMHDMSEALSSYSLSEATISELNELETF
ncbi:Short transient receptor potential channel 7, partial [Schistosoma japonicum]